MPIRAAAYIDGFNLYHAIADLNEPFLKWLNLVALMHRIMPTKSETLVGTTYCTAIYPKDTQKQWRHEQYIQALKLVGCSTIRGHYIHENMGCKACGHEWKKPTEKQTDVNLSLALFNDARLDVFDTAYLVTADSDQAATAKFLKANFPTKKLISVSPPGRNFSTHILAYADGKIALTRDTIEHCLFGPIVFKEGEPAGRRPREYDPPNGWAGPA